MNRIIACCLCSSLVSAAQAFESGPQAKSECYINSHTTFPICVVMGYPADIIKSRILEVLAQNKWHLRIGDVKHDARFCKAFIGFGQHPDSEIMLRCHVPGDQTSIVLKGEDVASLSEEILRLTGNLKEEKTVPNLVQEVLPIP